ncbi:hypothetical protein FHR83_003753 [Actinoplanes campanulatus]|uniref:Uncharacterized protein n=1 Tax=Actinoplanes campanulatus TaxID=113559 RepID=A0A7W5FEZ5_9ACTN|nr:hypothetical protein [Actinoplanes campanulatus]MBB3096083.1 hypothetical protein [Actinoplanes campanulatus]GGN13565.1 hypothetical protein GCM10010109_24670 [Actinoplanes campanulatus]GID36823.1 hypothetical protein Aca09nite_33290 [Actinoplanes campanulatus]
MIMIREAQHTYLAVGGPRRLMAALAPGYVLALAAGLALRFDPEFLAAALLYVPLTAVPMLFRGSRGFNRACYTVSVLLVSGGICGGIFFIPAFIPLLFATPPSLRAPVLHAVVAVVLGILATVIILVP